jgi:hypothetical protein
VNYDPQQAALWADEANRHRLWKMVNTYQQREDTSSPFPGGPRPRSQSVGSKSLRLFSAASVPAADPSMDTSVRRVSISGPSTDYSHSTTEFSSAVGSSPRYAPSGSPAATAGDASPHTPLKITTSWHSPARPPITSTPIRHLPVPPMPVPMTPKRDVWSRLGTGGTKRSQTVRSDPSETAPSPQRPRLEASGEGDEPAAPQTEDV